MCNSLSEVTDIETKHIAAGPYQRVLEVRESVSLSMLTSRTLFPPDGLRTECKPTQLTSSNCGVAESDVTSPKYRMAARLLRKVQEKVSAERSLSLH